MSEQTEQLFSPRNTGKQIKICDCLGPWPFIYVIGDVHMARCSNCGTELVVTPVLDEGPEDDR